MASKTVKTITYRGFLITAAWDKNYGFYADIESLSNPEIRKRTAFLCGISQAIKSAKYHIDKKTFYADSDSV